MKAFYNLFFLLICYTLFSQSTRKYSNEFLSIGVDARAFGMGNNVVANTSDVNSVYWNPAGLTGVKENWQAAAMHAEYFQSIAKYDYVAAAFPTRSGGTIGFSVIRFGVDDIINTTELIDSQGNIDYNKLSTFSTADYAGTVSYAKGNFLNNPNLSIGGSAKVVYRHIGKFATSYGFGLDAGLQYHTTDNFHFGVMARDITTTFNVWNIDEDEFKKIEVQGQTLNNPPEEDIELTLPKLALGVGKDIEINEKFGILAELNLNFQFAETNDLISTSALSFSPSAGFELNYDKMIFLRGGVNNVQFETNFDGNRRVSFQPNIGIGFKYRGISIDYALTDIGDKSIALYSNIFSLKFDMSGWLE